MGHRLLYLLPVALLAAAPAGATSLPSEYVRNLRIPLWSHTCAAIRALAQAQGDYADSAGAQRATWEWQRGTGQAAQNAGGIVAAALAQGPVGCSEVEVLRRYADARVREHRAGLFLFDPDIEALVLAGRVLDVVQYARVAREAFARRYQGASPAEVVGRWRLMQKRGRLVGYDAALAIRAAVAVGAHEVALGIADEVVRTGPDWMVGRDDDDGHLTVSRGALIEVLAALDAQRYAKPIQAWAAQLLAAQGSDGSFCFRNTQATAYAVRGLVRAPSERAADAAARGRSWLRLTQLRDGTWATFNDLLPEPFVGERINEVTAEAALALVER